MTGVDPNLVNGVNLNLVTGVAPNLWAGDTNLVAGVAPNLVAGVALNLVAGVDPKMVAHAGVDPNMISGGRTHLTTDGDDLFYNRNCVHTSSVVLTFLLVFGHLLLIIVVMGQIVRPDEVVPKKTGLTES